MKKKMFILCLLIFIFSCNDNKNSLKSYSKSIDSTKNQNFKKKQKNLEKEIYNEGGILIYGDASIDIGKISYIVKKFEPYAGC